MKYPVANGPSPAWRSALRVTAVVALAFSLFVLVELVLAWRGLLADRPIDQPQLVALKEQLLREPGSDALKDEFRAEEQRRRGGYLTMTRRLQSGAWLLLGGVLVFALTAGAVTRPRPVALASRVAGFDPDREAAIGGRVAVGAFTALLLGAAVATPILSQRVASIETAHGSWPRFRGPGGLGISSYANVPRQLDGRDDHAVNLRWKSVVPLPGMASPVVWNERVFLSGAIDSSREVCCFDALGGQLLWRRTVSAGAESTAIPEHINQDTGYAAPTPVTDGKRVFALFANGDLAAFDVFGTPLWCKNLGLPENMYGLASSPILHGEHLLVQLDQEDGPDGRRSALLCLDAASGDEVWRAPRDVASSWPTPIPLRLGEVTQIVTCANPFVIAYDAALGKELWRADCLEGDGGPSPTMADGLVIAVNIGASLAAIRPDGQGDVTKTHLSYRVDDGLPDVCSPLAADGRLFLLATDGLLSCVEARTGKPLWQHDLEVAFYSSPALAGDAIYLIGRKGKVFVVRNADAYELLGSGDLGEACDTSPAFADGRIYVRGVRHLFCFQEGGT